MNIRPFLLQDEDDVVQVWRDCQLVVPWNDPSKDIRRKLQVHPDLFLVGEVSGYIVATVMGGYEGHRGWINYLAVLPAYQGQGYGHKMMQAIETRLRDKGCPKINLQVRQTNTVVLAFYKSLGYQIDPVVSLGKRLESDV